VTISLIVAMGKNRGIGIDGNLPWHLPADLKHFKETTMGKPVIMGRKTYESIGKPLPGRLNIVLSKSGWTPVSNGVIVMESLEDAIEYATDLYPNSEIFIIGGGNLYEQAVHLVERMYITKVDAAPECDAFFPEYDDTWWFCGDKQQFDATETTPSFDILTMIRKKSRFFR
tara:strand:- start:1645 stop:2157 length:513 start_codon:yes stop_codon:yes gene_type:complete